MIEFDPVDITGRRHKRRSSPLRAVVQVIFFLASLIPMCIVAWRLDLLPQQAAQSIAQPAPKTDIASKVVRPAPTTQRRAIKIAEPPPVAQADSEPQPRKREPPALTERVAPKPGMTITLDLSATKQIEPIDIAGNLRLANVEGSSYSVTPVDGRLQRGKPLVIALSGPRPISLRLALSESASKRRIEIAPTVRNDAGDDIPLTVDNMERIGRRLIRDGQRATAMASALATEKTRLELWINSPVLKPLAARNQAIARVSEINVLLPEATAAVGRLEIEVRATNNLYESAKRLSGTCRLVFESILGD